MVFYLALAGSIATLRRILCASLCDVNMATTIGREEALVSQWSRAFSSAVNFAQTEREDSCYSNNLKHLHQINTGKPVQL
jgi:hypothetical protein